MTIILSQCDNDTTDIMQCISNNWACNQNDHSSEAGTETDSSQSLASVEQRSKLTDLQRKHPSISASIFYESGIDKLPNEIMCDIVHRVCLPAIYPLCRFDRDSPSSGQKPLHPLKLAKVCRRWRDLVFAIRKLWSAFSIQVNTPNMPFINLHLRLSGPTSPLSIRLFTRYNESIKEDAVFNAMALINENIHRIAYLCIDVPKSFYKILTSVSRTIADAAPTLEELHIHKHYTGLQSCSIQFRLCTNPPSPWKVYIDDYRPSNIHLDWQHVSQLRLLSSKLRSLDIVNVLSDAKSLVEFECDSTVRNEMTQLPTGVPIVLTSIRKVKISCSDSNCQVFLNTTMCSLESLTIDYFSSPEWNLFPPFLQRSASQLTSLELNFDIRPTGEDLINIFQYTLVLQSLKLHFDCSTCVGDARLLPFTKRLSMPVSQVSYPADNSICLPHLERLHLSGNFRIRYSPYLEIMENRHSTIALCGGGQVRALNELIIKTELPEERQITLTKRELRRVLELRKAKKTVMVSWEDEGSFRQVDLVEEAIASYKT